MDFDFTGKRALVTGATRGIGRGTSRLIHKLGGNVVALCCNKEWLTELSTELPGIETIHVDLSDWKATETALARIKPVDYLFNNAGVAYMASSMETTEDNFDRTSNVNIKATYNVTKVIAKTMIANGVKGAIVNVASIFGVFPEVKFSVYSALKAATENLTKSLAKELAPHGIRVNAVAPGLTDTEMAKIVTDDEVLKTKYLMTLPIKTIIKPEQIAKAVCFLLSDHASVITGVILPVDAGFLLNPASVF